MDRAEQGTRGSGPLLRVGHVGRDITGDNVEQRGLRLAIPVRNIAVGRQAVLEQRPPTVLVVDRKGQVGGRQRKQPRFERGLEDFRRTRGESIRR